MLTKLGKRARQLRQRYSRSYLLSRWLGFDIDQEEAHEPGLVVLQIDGLSRKQFEAALANKRLPFLKKLERLGYCERVSFYSGLPSTTPAVQGELMYGRKCAVPAFQFLHRKSGEVFRMFEFEGANTIVKERFQGADPLLKDGASYSNIYSGGATEARLCAEITTVPSVLKSLNPLYLPFILVLYFFTLLRIAWLAVVELIIAIGDMIRGLVTRGEWFAEIEFVPRRIFVSILLREWIRIMVKLSIAQGKPIIHANLLGYDEQAHRRGPSAAFAHWGLKGIDKVIEDIFKSAKRSGKRDYEVFVFSDHGQEDTRCYDSQTGWLIEEAVKRSLEESPLGKQAVHYLVWEEHPRSRNRQIHGPVHRRRGQRGVRRFTKEELAENVIVTAMGPLGHIYFPLTISDEVKADIANSLVNREQVPLVLYRTQEGNTLAHNAQGVWKVPEQIEQVCGADHPFLEELKDDLIRLSESPDAGDLMISGWGPKQPPLSFVKEHGAHGSLGSEETRGFALIPRRMPIALRESPSGERYIRGLDYYHAAHRFLGRMEKPKSSGPAPQAAPQVSCGEDAPSEGESPLRIVTYNTHNCVGLDGRCRPERIADVLADLNPNVVMLQEMDVNRCRSGSQDQAHAIAARLGMEHHFFPVWSCGGEHYGLAVLSKLPLTVLREAWLTEACQRTRREARGAIWGFIETPSGEKVHLLNTHLGLRSDERIRQVEELLGWLSDLEHPEPVIIAGDFNAGPNSLVVKRLCERFACTQCSVEHHRPRKTFPSMFPLRQLDYILVSPHFRVEQVSVPRNHFTLVASDHLPLCVDLILSPERDSSKENVQARTNHQLTDMPTAPISTRFFG